jgi:crossover junction endodeoxyribonuclease RuvC
MTVFIGVDPASATGAVGVLDSEGNFINCQMIEHSEKHIRAMVFKNALLKFAPAHEGGEIAIEMLYSRPGQSASAMWTFARAVGAITAICELTNLPMHFVRPQVWRQFYHLPQGKHESLDVARMLWPEAPLKRKMDHNLADALLIGEYWRQQVKGLRDDKATAKA